jgi:hypothetical protein
VGPFCTELHPNGLRNMKSTGRIHFCALSKVWLSQSIFTKLTLAMPFVNNAILEFNEIRAHSSKGLIADIGSQTGLKNAVHINGVFNSQRTHTKHSWKTLRLSISRHDRNWTPVTMHVYDSMHSYNFNNFLHLPTINLLYYHIYEQSAAPTLPEYETGNTTLCLSPPLEALVGL